ncbi:MAG: acyltransferase [Lentimicrobiaceae bacterium]|nr:acyltransferase [Lentimicrobiaceae bacterium]
MSKINNFNASVAFADTKPHYILLDGLRGVAALMVLWYHVFEGFAFAKGSVIETFNHGHLGVDFFFLLSGFVISYAYDDRWFNDKSLKSNDKSSTNKTLTIWSFFKRRLIRLHPMLVMGAFIGLICFFIQGGVKWDGSSTPLHWTLIAFVLTLFFIPAYPGASYDIRGNAEMFPLNGPSWSLFFEYIGNILYALFIRKLSNKMLTVLVGATGILWIWFVAFDISGYDMIGIGWTLDVVNFFGGLLRMMFPFTLGMLMARLFSQRTTDNRRQSFFTNNIFWIATIVLFALFSVPYISGEDVTSRVPALANISLNGIYELFCIMVVFPLIVWIAALSDSAQSKFTLRISKFLGDLSYPLYIVHYPVMYLFYAWLIKNQYYTLGETWQMVILVLVVCIVLAYACLKLYDEPIRKWLSKVKR